MHLLVMELLSKFQKHETTQSHKDSMVCWNSYKASLSKGNVVEQIEAASTTEIMERRQYLERIAVTTQTKKQRKRPLKFSYQPIKHVMCRLCGNACPKWDII